MIAAVRFAQRRRRAASAAAAALAGSVHGGSGTDSAERDPGLDVTDSVEIFL